MPWTWEEIQEDWLKGARLAVSPDAVVDAFNRAELTLGRDWVEQSRVQGTPPNLVRGSSPTLGVVSMGQHLAVLEGVPNSGALVERIRKGSYAAEAELTAIYLLASGESGAIIDPEPVIAVRDGTRKPDFRVRRRGVRWTYVEVTQPGVSQLQKRVTEILGRLTSLVRRTVKKSFAVEVFLRREPSSMEVNHLLTLLPEFCSRDGVQSQDLPDDLGRLFLNHDAPGRASLRQHQGENHVPRLSAAGVIRGPDEPHRHIMVRIPFTDGRAARFLKREAGQLPTNRPGLIMVQMSNAPGGFGAWEPLLSRQLGPQRHTRVSAICLWQSGLEPMPSGEAWIPRIKLIANPYARCPLPSWIAGSLARWKTNDKGETL